MLLACDAVREILGEEVEENDAQTVDVGRGRDRLAFDLFGAGVLRRQRAELRDVAGVFRVGVEQFGDAEVEQLRLPAFVDEDVRRLEVAVDDEVAVGEGDRVADLVEELQPVVEGELTALAVAGRSARRRRTP